MSTLLSNSIEADNFVTMAARRPEDRDYWSGCIWIGDRDDGYDPAPTRVTFGGPQEVS
jgi:hypothetical protein